MAKLSIIIPLYNAQAFIPKLMQTLNEQTCKDFAVIFIDDASTDNSVKVLQLLDSTKSGRTKTLPEYFTLIEPTELIERIKEHNKKTINKYN